MAGLALQVVGLSACPISGHLRGCSSTKHTRTSKTSLLLSVGTRQSPLYRSRQTAARAGPPNTGRGPSTSTPITSALGNTGGGPDMGKGQLIESPPAVLWVGVVAGLTLLGVAAYVEGPLWPGVSQTRDIAFFLFQSKEGVRWAFWLANGAHVVEAVVAYVVATGKGLGQQRALLWAAQTGVLGFFSLKLLLDLKPEVSKEA